MQMRIAAMVIMVVTLVTLAQCNVHSFGSRILFGDSLIEQRLLFSSDSITPQNYTVIFKSIGMPYATQYTYVEIKIENNYSNGSLTVDTELGKIDATINIVNGTLVTVRLLTYGQVASYGIVTLPAKSRPKSFTIVQVQNATQTAFKRNAVGRRQPNDRLIYFKSQNVTKLSRFADKEFEFYANDKQVLTCVGFSFSSPTAVAFLNSTFIKSNEIAAIAYDLSQPHFIANMSVFGYENTESIPGKYRHIVDVQ